jgi:integrase
VLKDMPRCGPTVFTISANALRLAWERLRRRAGIFEVRFNDLRYEADSRFFERGLNVPEVAMISGHRDPRMLFRYTHPKPEEVAAKLSGVIFEDMHRPGWMFKPSAARCCRGRKWRGP